MEWSGGPQDVGCTLRLDRLPTGSDRVLLMVYVYAAMGPIRDIGSLHLKVDGDIEHRLDLRDNGEAAIIIGEFYQRNEQWKFRALSEGSAYGLSAFGRKIGLTWTTVIRAARLRVRVAGHGMSRRPARRSWLARRTS